MTLPEPKKGRVCSASRNRASAVSRLAAVGNGGLDDFVVHAAQLFATIAGKVFGAFLDGEFVVAANEGHRLKVLTADIVLLVPGSFQVVSFAGAKN